MPIPWFEASLPSNRIGGTRESNDCHDAGCKPSGLIGAKGTGCGGAAQRYAVIRGAVGDPDPFRVRYREAIAGQVVEIIRSRCDRREAVAHLRRWAEASVIETDRKRFVIAAEETL